MINFLHETMSDIAQAGKNYQGSIRFIGSADGVWGCTWEEFTKLADFEYDPSYGAAEIPQDFIIVFDDGSYMERGEYDGSEWWNYHTTPAVPTTYKTIKHLDRRGSWSTVAEDQKEEED